MKKTMKGAMALVASAAIAGGALVTGSGETAAAPRYTENFPAVSSGTGPAGFAWQGFLLTKEQTRTLGSTGVLVAWDSTFSVVGQNITRTESYREATGPGGAGCVLVMLEQRGGYWEPRTFPASEVMPIRTKAGAEMRLKARPDLAPISKAFIRYWTTEYFKCA